MPLAQIESLGRLGRIDYWIVGVYLVVSIGLGVWFSRRGTKDAAAYFAGSGEIPWWIAGTSLLVACFAADTPLWIGEIIYKRGLEGAWMYWAPAIGTAFFVVLIAPLWKRSGVLTDIEFLELRYSGVAASAMRLFNSAFYSLFASLMWMCLQTLSITIILQSITDLSKFQCVVATVVVATSYAAISGLWGVASSGALQFVITYVGSVILAVYAVFVHVGGIEKLVTGVQDLEESWPQGAELSIVPSGDAYALPMMTLLALFLFRWIEQAGMGQFVAQRLIATKNCRQAVYTAMIWGIGFFAIVPLPWIVTVVAAKLVLPDLEAGDEAYPRLAMMLPVGLRGVLIASMLAAFMSTYSSLMSWGSSYAINDFYRRFLVRDAGEKHYVRAGQIYMLLMAIISGCLALWAESVLNVLLFVLSLMSGYWTVMFLRWVWWRVNAWAEMAALGGSIALSIVTAYLPVTRHWWASETMEEYFGHRMIFIMLGSLIIWLVVMWCTPPADPKVLDSFYGKVRPPGWWGPVRQRLNLPLEVPAGMIAYCWLVMLVAIYGLMFGLLKLAFGEYGLGGALTAMGVGAVALAVQVTKQLYDD